MASNPGDIRFQASKVPRFVRSTRMIPATRRVSTQLQVGDAKERGIPIRVGVNAGSLPPIPALKDGEMPPTTVQRMVDAAMWEINIIESMEYDNIKLSMKAFDVPTMVEAYRQIAPMIPYPLHLGVTEAGTPRAGSVRSAIGIG